MEQSTAWFIVCVYFHRGYVVYTLLLSQLDLKLQDLVQKSNIGIYTLKCNHQLFQQLEQFRTILYATVSILRLHNSITSIEKELDALSPEECEYWLRPPKEFINDPACDDRSVDKISRTTKVICDQVFLPAKSQHLVADYQG